MTVVAGVAGVFGAGVWAAVCYCLGVGDVRIGWLGMIEWEMGGGSRDDI